MLAGVAAGPVSRSTDSEARIHTILNANCFFYAELFPIRDRLRLFCGEIRSVRDEIRAICGEFCLIRGQFRVICDARRQICGLSCSGRG